MEWLKRWSRDISDKKQLVYHKGNASFKIYLDKKLRFNKAN